MPSPKKPVPTPISKLKQPIAKALPAKVPFWVFSFRFWKQVDYFGLGNSQSKWFVSLLTKLSELSKERVDSFKSDGHQREHWRYHEIKWTQENIPIRRQELDWLDKDYFENPEEYPIYQFQVSQALGRVIGFWDEHNVFNIVLLDPLHNMQPSKLFNYTVTPTTPLPCHYTSLLGEIDKVKQETCIGENCPVSAKLVNIPSGEHYHEVIIIRLEDQIKKRLDAALELGLANSIVDLVDAGIESLSR